MRLFYNRYYGRWIYRYITSLLDTDTGKRRLVIKLIVLFIISAAFSGLALYKVTNECEWASTVLITVGICLIIAYGFSIFALLAYWDVASFTKKMSKYLSNFNN